MATRGIPQGRNTRGLIPATTPSVVAPPSPVETRKAPPHTTDPFEAIKPAEYGALPRLAEGYSWYRPDTGEPEPPQIRRGEPAGLEGLTRADVQNAWFVYNDIRGRAPGLISAGTLPPGYNRDILRAVGADEALIKRLDQPEYSERYTALQGAAWEEGGGKVLAELEKKTAKPAPLEVPLGAVGAVDETKKRVGIRTEKGLEWMSYDKAGLTKKDVQQVLRAMEAQEPEFTLSERGRELLLADRVVIGGMSMKVDDWNALDEKYQTIANRQGFDAMEKAIQKDIADFEAKHLKLADGKWMAKDQWNELPEKYRTIGSTRGYDAMTGAIKAEQEKIDGILSRLQEFRIKEPTAVAEYPEGSAPFEYYEKLEQYDIPAALRRGMTPEELQEVFPPAAVKAAQKFNEDLEKGAKAEELYREQLWRNVRTGDVVTQEQMRAITTERPVAADEFVREQPALILPADPKWQELKDRPDSDPEKQAYRRQWIDKVIDFGTFASIAATPFTMSAIGVVGKALTIPKVATWAFNIGKVGIKPVAVAATIINSIPRAAVSMAKLANLGPFVLGASRITDQVRTAQLQADWDTFQKLPSTEKDKWADQAGYGKPFGQLTNEQKSVVLIQYSNPPETTRQEWLEQTGEKIGGLNFYASQKAGWLQNKAPVPIANTVTFAGGAVVGTLEGLGYMASIPILAASLGAAVPAGSVAMFARQTIRGMAEFFTKDLPMAFAINPALAAGRVTGLFILSPQAALKLAKSGLVRAFPRYIPERAMSIEYSTARIRFDKIAEFVTKPKAERIKIAEEIVARLLKGEKRVTVKGISATIDVRNVPYQEVIGNTLWNFSNRPLEAGSKLYTSPQAAIRFGIATAGGKLIKGTTLNEIRVPEGFKPKMEKLLRRGEAELESIFGKDVRYEPIPGWTGKGVSTNVITGPYPIRRFTILGEATAVKKLTPKVLLEIRAKSAQAALGDLIKGWSGRKEALREIFRVDPRTERLQAAIQRLKTEKPYVAIADNVKTQRSSVPHPDFKGELKTRVRLITYNQAGDAVFLGLDRSAPSFEFMGGSANPKEILLQSGKWHNFEKSGRSLTWGEAARSQLIGEANMRMPETKYVGTYLGKVNDNALHGARVYKGKAVGQPDIVAAWNRFQRRKFGYNTPELKAGVWLYKDGTVKGIAGLKTSATEAVGLFSELGANPATKDLLAYVAKADGFKVDSVKVDTGNKWLLKARDAGFADRAVSGKPLTPKQIASINKAEIKYLKQRRMDIAKGAEPAIMDYLTAEGELRTVAELIHGRRKATTIRPNESLRQKTDTAIIEMIKKDTSSSVKVAKDLLAKGKTRESVRAYEKTMTQKAKTDLYDRLKRDAEEAVKATKEKIYDQYGDYLYRPEVYAGQYVAWLQRYTAAALANRPLELVRAREGATPAQLARIIIEAREFDRPFISTRVEPSRVGTRLGVERVEPAPTAVSRVTPTDVERVEPVPTTEEPRFVVLPGGPLGEPPPPPPPPPRRPPGEPPRPLVRLQTRSPLSQPLPEGSIAWRQGIFWKYIPPPWTQDKPITLPEGIIPMGAVKTDLRTPAETVQMIGQSRTAKVPQTITTDLGTVDIKVSERGRRIEFAGSGLETNVGTRIESTTEGMSVLSDAELAVVDKALYGRKGVSRPTMGKVKPPRKGKRRDWLTELTTVGRIR